MDNKIEINDKEISDYLMFKLDKIDNSFTIDELKQIKELVIDLYNSDIAVLVKLNNIHDLTIRNGSLSNDDFKFILNLENLNSICFENCEIENADLIASLNINSLEIINCNLNNFKFINLIINLSELTIINENIDIEIINKIENLKYLQISHSNIIGDNIINNKNIESLYIDHTNIRNLDFIKDLNSLKLLSIDYKQYQENKELIDKLPNDIKVYEERINLISGDQNE